MQTNRINNSASNNNNAFSINRSIEKTPIKLEKEGSSSETTSKTISGTASPTKRTSNTFSSLSPAPKRQKINQEVVVENPDIQDSAETILNYYEKINNGDGNSIKLDILINKKLSNDEKAFLLNMLCEYLLNTNNADDFLDSNSIIILFLLITEYDGTYLSRIYYNLSIGYYHDKLYDKAFKAVNEALKLQNNNELNGKLYNHLSAIHFAQGKFDAAIVAAHKGLPIKHLSEECKNSLSSSLEKAKEAIFKMKQAEKATLEVEAAKTRDEETSIKTTREQSVAKRKTVINIIQLCEDNKNDPNSVINHARDGLNLPCTFNQRNQLNIYLFDALFATEKFEDAKNTAAQMIAYAQSTNNFILPDNPEIQWCVRKIRTFLKLEQWTHANQLIKKVINEFSDLDCDSLGQIYFYSSEIHLNFNNTEHAKTAVENGRKLSNISDDTQKLLNENLVKINTMKQ